MDQTLKARLIGAAVLVALVVILVPELLSGRRTDPAPADDAVDTGRRTFTIELGADRNGEAPRAKVQTPTPAPAPMPSGAVPAATEGRPDAVASDLAAADPGVPAGATAEPVADAAAPGPVPSPEPADVAGPSPLPPAASAPAGGGWVVQAGAFGSAAAAERLVRELESDGYAARVSPVTRSGRTLHRVRVGTASDRAGADQLAQRLRARGLQPAVVAND